ncbi:ATP-dependent DNA ligase [Streptomyces goshikiensis]|uniref:ATP-dependent DNA ligase n=1 Tax=Streptomyces goshikiensis TaxID=1942 RepID=UPI00365F5A7F
MEPKLDGWRCQVHASAGRLWSRHGTDLTDRFSDIAQGARELPDCVLDGELVAVLNTGEVAFTRLQTRSSRGPRPGADFSVHLAVFDALAIGDTDLRPRPYRERRTQLLDLLEHGPPSIRPVPVTTDVEAALAWVGGPLAVEGVVMKPDRAYAAGHASGWEKWRRMHTSEAVVLGVSGRTPGTQCLVLGLPGIGGRLRAVGVSLPLAQSVRRDLVAQLNPTGESEAQLPGTVGGLPGADPVRYLPVVADVVVEIEADQLRPREYGRFRHRPRVLRIRGDLTVDNLPSLPLGPTA